MKNTYARALQLCLVVAALSTAAAAGAAANDDNAGLAAAPQEYELSFSWSWGSLDATLSGLVGNTPPSVPPCEGAVEGPAKDCAVATRWVFLAPAGTDDSTSDMDGSTADTPAATDAPTAAAAASAFRLREAVAGAQSQQRKVVESVGHGRQLAAEPDGKDQKL